jgi:hypothetical protein
VSCWTSAATRELPICASAERHHITASPAVASANHIMPAAIDRTGNGAGGTRRSCRAARTATRARVTATAPKEPRYTSTKAQPIRVEPPRAPPVAPSTPANMPTSPPAARFAEARSILVRSTVGQRVRSVPVTVRPTKPSTFTSWWASSRRPCHGSPGLKAITAPRTAPTGSRQAAAMYARTVNAKRGASAARTCAPSAAAYQTRAPETISAPSTTTHGQDGSIPRIVTTMPTVSSHRRRTCRGLDSSPSRVFSSASVKCCPQIMIEVVISPSVTMCTISQRACGSHWWTSTTAISASIHPSTGREARRCQAPRPVAGERREERPGAGAGRDGTGGTTSGRDPGQGGGRPVGKRAGTVPE